MAPPTPDHVEMKQFMIAQLEESIRFDCWEPRACDTPDAASWHANAIREVTRDLDYHIKENAKEIERTAERNAWIAALRESLSATA